MLSPVQRNALRSIIVDAVSVGVPAAVQVIPAARVVWAGQDHPTPWPLPIAVLQIIAAEEQGLDGERIVSQSNDPTPELIETVRTVFDVTVSLQVATRKADDAPSHAHDAWTLARRILTRIRSSIARDLLADVGTGIQRLTGIRDLSSYMGSQNESRVALDLVLRIAALDETRPGWIESIAGTGNLVHDGAGSPMSVPFAAQTPDED